MTPISRIFLLVLLAALLGARCVRSFQSVALDAPRDETLFDDPAPVVSMSGRVGTNFTVASIDVWLDGVPLAASLGLTPPFEDQGGVVLVGPDPITVSGFDVSETKPRQVRAQLEGLVLGSHLIELRASTSSQTKSAGADVHLIGPMTLEAEAFVAAGLPFGVQPGGAEGELANATLGQAAAVGSVLLSSGDELRAGFVPVAEAIIMGSVP